VLSLYTPDGGFAGAAAGAAVALVAAVAAARGPGWWAATPGALVAFLGAAAWREGPHPGLGGRALPAATGSEVPYRVPFGCVVEAGGGVVTLADHRESPECPPRVERFPAGRRRATPLFALPPEAPIEETWPAAGGEVALLAQWPGTGRSRWGVIRIDATVLAPPGEAAPGAVPPVNLLVTDPQGRAPAGGGDQARRGVAARRSAGRGRVRGALRPPAARARAGCPVCGGDGGSGALALIRTRAR
jgi:hypothetical protein